MLQGFIAEHRDIELLKLRNFTVGKKIDESMLCADDVQEKIADIVRALSGFVSVHSADAPNIYAYLIFHRRCRF